MTPGSRRLALALVSAITGLALASPTPPAHAEAPRHIVTAAGAFEVHSHHPSGELAYAYAPSTHLELGLAVGVGDVSGAVSYAPYLDPRPPFIYTVYVVPTFRVRSGPGGGPVASLGVGWAGIWERGADSHADGVRIELGLLERVPLSDQRVFVTLGVRVWGIEGRWGRNEAGSLGIDLAAGLEVAL